VLLSNQKFKPLTNRALGSYCKLQTEISPFDLWPKHKARGPRIEGDKKLGSVYYSRDRENEVSKKYKYLSRMSDGSSHAERLQMTDVRQKQNDKLRDQNSFKFIAGRTVEPNPLNWPVTATVVTEN